MDIQKAIQTLKGENELMLFNPSTGEVGNKYRLTDLDRDFYETHESCVKMLEELEQYRQIGTVDEIKKSLDELRLWHKSHTNERIKNPFANQSTLICHNCDHKDEYIEELEITVEEYEQIGTVDECRTAIEKRMPMKPIIKTIKDIIFSACPKCFCFSAPGSTYCRFCGQALDWTESEGK